jgi:hypothetical protein
MIYSSHYWRSFSLGRVFKMIGSAVLRERLAHLCKAESKFKWVLLDLKKLQSSLKYEFRNYDLLLLALTHPSCAIEEIETNRRLEFLGDKFLGAIIANALYSKYPEEYEGTLTDKLSRITANWTLAIHAKAIDLGQYLRTSSDPRIRTLDIAGLTA